MEWTKEKDDELTALINSGKRFDEISLILNTSFRSITNRVFRLKLKTKFYVEIECKCCGFLFNKRVKSKTMFCSKSCAAKVTNKNRILSDETKNKIAEKLKGKIRKPKIKKIRLCRNCSNEVLNKKIICDECKNNYYKFYRPQCEFNFNINDYKDKFNISLVEQYGWYSPSNKGNNLNGVSRDHMYCVRDGFINKIDPEIIKHPANCMLMKHSDNNLKNYTSSITIEELLERIKKW